MAEAEFCLRHMFYRVSVFNIAFENKLGVSGESHALFCIIYNEIAAAKFDGYVFALVAESAADSRDNGRRQAPVPQAEFRRFRARKLSS